MAGKLLLVRHADTGSRYQGRFIGSTDVAASGEGLAQVGRLQALLKQYQPGSWYCSPSRRARQTETMLRRFLPFPEKSTIRKELREIDFGDWERLSFAEIEKKYPVELGGWAALDPDFCFPGGESFRDFTARISAVLTVLLADPAEQILIVTHGGVIRTMICLLLGLDLKNYLLFDVRPATLTRIDLFGNSGMLTGLNL